MESLNANAVDCTPFYEVKDSSRILGFSILVRINTTEDTPRVNVDLPTYSPNLEKTSSLIRFLETMASLELLRHEVL